MDLNGYVNKTAAMYEGEKECLKLKITNQHYSVGYDAKNIYHLLYNF